MKAFIIILTAALTLFGNVLIFQSSGWGIDFITEHYWARFIQPVVMSFIFAGVATESFADYARPWKIGKRLNPTRLLFVSSVIITCLMALLIE